MNILLPLLIVVATVLSGYSVAIALLPQTGRRLEQMVLQSSFGGGIGIGITAIVYFVFWSALKLGFTAISIVYVVASVAAFAAAVFFEGKAPKVVALDDSGADDKPAKILKLAFGAVLLGNIIAFLYQCYIRPHGDFDAMMVWNLHARFITDMGGDIKQALPMSLFWAHPEYGVLLPLFISVVWFAQQSMLLAVSHAVAFVYTFATFAIFWSTLCLLKDRLQAVLASLVLLTTPFFVLCGTMLIADTPMGFYITATTACVMLQARYPEKRRALTILAGLCAGLSMWLKKEGMLFTVCLLLATIVQGWRKPKDVKLDLAEKMAFAVGLAPGTFCWMAQKVIWPAASRSAASYFTPAMLINWSSYLQVVVPYAIQLVTFGQWRISPVPFLILYWLIYKERQAPELRQVSQRILFTIVILMAGYFVQFVIYPNIKFVVTIALHRLIMQLWPSFLMIFFLNCQSPKTIMALKPEPVAQA